MDSGLHAERALLGAVLADPGRQQHVLGCVQPDDFYRPWHGQVHAAIQRLHARGVLAGPQQVYAELKDDPDLPQSVSHDAVPLADLLAAAPRPSHAPTYAGIVIASSLRRWLGVWGGRLRQAAQASDEPVDDLVLEGVRHVVSGARADAEAGWRRWASLPGEMRRELPVPARDSRVQAEVARRAGRVRDELARLHEDLWAQDSARVAGRLAGIARDVAGVAAASAGQAEQAVARSASREARPSGAAAEAVGRAALRDLIAAPSRIGEVTGWLEPRHFARPGHGEVFAILDGLHRAKMPVDPVTVSWEASRRGLQIQPEELAGGCGAFVPGSAAQVYRRAVLAQVERAGTDIQAAAAEPAFQVAGLMHGAGKLLARLEASLEPDRCSLSRGADVIALHGRGEVDRAGRTPEEPAAWEAAR